MYYIYSIQRLSDGEIFSIGDVCEGGKISQFTSINNRLVIYFESIEKSEARSTFDINHNWLKMLKKPVFISSDNVEIFHNDEVFECFAEGEFVFNQFPCNKNYPYPTVGEGWKVFSTKEKAEEFLMLHKPCLSINDIYGVSEISRDIHIKIRLSELEYMVKTRI